MATLVSWGVLWSSRGAPILILDRPDSAPIVARASRSKPPSQPQSTGGRKFTGQIAAPGLRKDIREIAHRELDATARKKAEPRAPAEEREQTAAEDRDPCFKWISPWAPRRPSAGYFPAPTGKRR